MAERKKLDLPFEALAEVTGTDWNAGRGELNVALASIKEQWAGSDSELPVEIKERARLYRRLFPGIALTPTALAKHWLRVFEEAHQRSTEATNQSAPYVSCNTCNGHRFVVCGTRPYPETAWMSEHGFKSKGSIEEWAPCPECSATVITSRRFDGTVARTPDPEKVREMMGR